MKTFWRVTLTLMALAILSGFMYTQAVDYIIPTAIKIWELKDPTPGISGMMWMAVATVGMVSVWTVLVKNIVKPVSFTEGACYVMFILFITLVVTIIFGTLLGGIELARHPTVLKNRSELLSDSMGLISYFNFWFNKASLIGLILGWLITLLFPPRSQPQSELLEDEDDSGDDEPTTTTTSQA